MVSALGFGAMHLNDERVSEEQAGHLLNAVLDLGVNLIDTARGYGLSEERIGRHLAHRRQDFVLSTKVGYGIEGVADWTYECIVRGIDSALGRLRCEHIDIVHLHSCPLHVLERGDVILALEDCLASGKLGLVAYAGDNDALDFAIQCGRFASVQTSLNVCDQVNRNHRLPEMKTKGIGVIAKRPLAGTVWSSATRPHDQAEGEYWDRWQAMGLASRLDGMSPSELALRFAAHCVGVSSVIAGTLNIAHFEENVRLMAKGKLPDATLAHIHASFAYHGQNWAGVT